jgi:hypothetical protein
VVHSAIDALKSGFALFNLKASSLFAFRPKTDIQFSNLKTIHGIGKVPSDNGLRNILDRLNASTLNKEFARVLPYLEQLGRLDDYHEACRVIWVQPAPTPRKKVLPSLIVDRPALQARHFAHLVAQSKNDTLPQTFIYGPRIVADLFQLSQPALGQVHPCLIASSQGRFHPRVQGRQTFLHHFQRLRFADHRLGFHDRFVLAAPFFVQDEVDRIDVLAVLRAVGLEAVDGRSVALHRGGAVFVEGAGEHAVAVGG